MWFFLKLSLNRLKIFYFVENLITYTYKFKTRPKNNPIKIYKDFSGLYIGYFGQIFMKKFEIKMNITFKPDIIKT